MRYRTLPHRRISAKRPCVHRRRSPRIRESGVEAVKMMSQTEPAVSRANQGDQLDIEIITRLYDDRIGHGHPTPAEFVERMAPVMAALQPYCAKYQIANE